MIYKYFKFDAGCYCFDINSLGNSIFLNNFLLNLVPAFKSMNERIIISPFVNLHSTSVFHLQALPFSPH